MGDQHQHKLQKMFITCSTHSLDAPHEQGQEIHLRTTSLWVGTLCSEVLVVAQVCVCMGTIMFDLHVANHLITGSTAGEHGSSFFRSSFPAERSAFFNSFPSNFSNYAPKSKKRTNKTIEVSFKESVFGCTKNVSIEHDIACSACVGTGSTKLVC